MCAIAGLVHLDGDGPPETERVRAMLAAMRHRGPDDTAVVRLPGVTLGNSRLAILDPRGSRQPMGDRATGCHLTFNGAILNYVELRRELEAAGESFTTQGDTEVLLRLLTHDGLEALGRLDGMFAFAFHDPRRRRTVLARDALGIKPLVWARDGNDLLFASEPKGLLAGLRGRPALDRDALVEYLAFQLPLGDDTLFKGVRRLAPGTLLDIEPGSFRLRPWWTPPVADPDPAAGAGAAERLRAAIETSVTRCLRSDRPVGTFLSGGLDSSLVTALAARAEGGPPPAFHGTYAAGPGFDEVEHARTTAAATGTELVEVRIDPAAVAEALPRLARALDEPMAGPGAIGSWFVAKAAAERVTVVLGGQGADELLSGYARHLAVEFGEALHGAAASDPTDLLALLPGLGALRGYEPLLQRTFTGGPAFPGPEERFFRTVHRGDALTGVLRDDLAREVGHARPRERFDAVFPAAETGGLRSRLAEFERRTLLPALLHVEDRTTMAHGLEGRVPLLGTEVVAAALSTPDVERFRGGGLKPLLRGAAAPHLPASVLAREDKMGFPVPLAAWARGPLRDFFHDLLLDRTARERGWTRPAAVQRLLEDATVDARGLWALVMLELWCRENVGAR